MSRIIVGSRAFFQKMENFNPKDLDVVEIVEGYSFKHVRQFRLRNKCVFQWKRMTADEFVDATIERNIPMEMGKFLVPEFINEIGLTIEQLKRLQPLVESLDDMHKYEKVIYDAYVENNDFVLSDEQLNNAYNEYLKYR